MTVNPEVTGEGLKFAVYRSPFTVHRSPFTVRRSPFAVRRSRRFQRYRRFRRSAFGFLDPEIWTAFIELGTP